MKIGFIGAGKVGTSLGRYIAEQQTNGVSVSGYYSRRLESAEFSAKSTNSACFTRLSFLVDASDILFLTVPDHQITPVWQALLKLGVREKILCHCSGVTSSTVFQNREVSSNFAYSIHPLLAFCSKQTSIEQLSRTCFTIEGDPEYLYFWNDFFQATGNPVKEISSADKVKYHSAAVFASNLVLATLGVACDLLEECGFSKEDSRDALVPIVSYNVDNFSQVGLTNALTGPIERGDCDTVSQHLDILSPDQKEVYRLLSQRLLPLAVEKKPILEKNPQFLKLKQILEN